MAWDFRPGMRVVCVKSPTAYVTGASTNGEILPTKGDVYTIRDAVPSAFAEIKYVALRFVEIVNEPQLYSNGFEECRFVSWNFRPLDESRLDCFRALLKEADASAPRKTERV